MADTYGHYSNLTTVREEYMDDVSETAVDADVLAEGAKVAHDLINAKCMRFYAVPFALASTLNTPALIQNISHVLTAYWANSRTVGLGVKGRGPTADDCKRARTMLDEVAAGKLGIPGVTASGVLPECSTRDEHPVFDKVGEHEWGQDDDQTDRISDERD